MAVALVSDAASQHLDADLPPLLAALRERGVAGDVVHWDDPGVDWSCYRMAVVRSPWTYFRRLDRFLAWIDSTAAATDLQNPPHLLRWNTDKTYLRDLSSAGIPIVPTTFIAPGDDPAGMALPPGRIVVKPAISAGANDTAAYGADEAEQALAHVVRLIAAGRTAMVQPYAAGVDAAGETALLFFAGRLSHAIRKGPILRDGAVELVEGLYAPEDISARTPTDPQIAVAERVIATIPGEALYARVDLVPADDGTPQLLELELTEPSVFLDHAGGAAARFAAAIAVRLNGAPT